MNESKCCGRCGPRDAAPVGWLKPDGSFKRNPLFFVDRPLSVGGDIPLRLAAPAQAEPSPTLPAGWVPLVLAFEPDYPEEIAYGPPRMMERLKKWLDKHFAARVAEADAMLATRETS